MFGRLRTFRHLGGEVRGEWANQNSLGFRQDFQAGIRYEYQDMTNKNVLGREGEILENGDKGAVTFFDRSLDANTVSAFLQSNIYVARISTCCRASALSGSTSIAGTVSSPLRKARPRRGSMPGGATFASPMNASRSRNPDFIPTRRGRAPRASMHCRASPSPTRALPFDALWRLPPRPDDQRAAQRGLPFTRRDRRQLQRRTTLIGHHGLRLRGRWLLPLFQDFQYGESFAAIAGDREFGRADEVEIRGVELSGRLNSQPFTGGRSTSSPRVTTPTSQHLEEGVHFRR